MFVVINGYRTRGKRQRREICSRMEDIKFCKKCYWPRTNTTYNHYKIRRHICEYSEFIEQSLFNNSFVQNNLYSKFLD